MGMVVRTNTMAINAYRQLGLNNNAVAKSLEKLASGYRINRAGDDAAGLAISEKMKAQITGLETASANAQDGISLIQTAEGNLSEVHDMLNRMVELASKSANGTYTSQERQALQDEVNQLLDEIDRIAQSANFNGAKLLDGSLDSSSLGKEIASGLDRILPDDTGVAIDTDIGVKTILDGVNVESAKTKFALDFTGMTGSASASSMAATGTADTAQKTSDQGDDVVALNTENLKAALEADDNYDAAEFNPAAAGGAKADVKIQHNTDKWEIHVGSITLEAAATLDADGKTLTLAVDGATVATITAADAVQANGDAVAEADFEAKYVAEWATGSQYSTGSEMDVKMEGASILSAPITVSADMTAEDMAKAVLAQLDVDNGGDGSAETVDLAWNGYNYTVSVDGNKLVFDLQDDPDATNIKGDFDWDVEGGVTGTHTAGTTVITAGALASQGSIANTVFKIEDTDIQDGATITVDGKTVTLAVGKDSKIDVDGENVVDLRDMEVATDDAAGTVDIDIALGRIVNVMGDTENFIVGVNNTGNNDTHQGITVAKKVTLDDGTTNKNVYDTKEKLAAVFSLNAASEGKPLTLQIGDTADSYNKMSISVADMSAKGLGLEGLKKTGIMTESSASDAIDTIKTAINTVSSTRAGLGALQNRLEHTINNLDVAAENLSAANSRIRDTDMAKEMMNYTKMNVLVQSAQAMLAQANQQPQSVLQLLQ